MSEPLRLRKPEVLQQQSTSVDANLEKQNTIKRTFAHANSYNLLINFQGVLFFQVRIDTCTLLLKHLRFSQT